MPQYLRPDSNVTTTGYTGGFADIDEETASDADLAYGTINVSTSVLEVGLTNPAVTPGGANGVVRWRSATRNGNGVIDGGNSLTGTCGIYQGATLITSDAYTAGPWSTREFTFALSSVSDYTDLRLRFTQTASGGANNGQRSSLAVSWAEVEVPDKRRVTVVS